MNKYRLPPAAAAGVEGSGTHAGMQEPVIANHHESTA